MVRVVSCEGTWDERSRGEQGRGGGANYPRLPDLGPSGYGLRNAMKFLTHNATDKLLEIAGVLRGVLAKCSVDQRLVVFTARSVHLLPKPVKNVIVQSNRDARLSLDDRPRAPAYP